MQCKRRLFFAFVALFGGTTLLLQPFDRRLSHYSHGIQSNNVLNLSISATSRLKPVNWSVLTNQQNEVSKYKTQHVELANIRDVVQKRIDQIQNPQNCSQARKLLCKIEPGIAGFGCLLHRIGVCFLLAIGSNRTLVVNMTMVTYPSIKSMFEAYLPLSETCSEWSEDEYEAAQWIHGNRERETTAKFRVVKLFRNGGLRPFTPFAPNSYPTSLKDKLQPLHSEPQIWWFGQIMMYLTRPQPKLTQALNKYKAELGFSHPIVGVHIRRTDKLKGEADFHSLEEYMIHVKKWYDNYDDFNGGNVTRRVFLATDDVTIHKEALDKYPKFSFSWIANNSYFAQKQRRTSDEGFWGIVYDVALLSQCDYVVCTFTSNIGRLVHEVMVAESNNPLRYATSIDVEHFSVGEIRMLREVIEDYYPDNPKELELRVGDIIENVRCKRICLGKNRRTKKRGSYPKEKVRTLPPTALYAGMQNIFNRS
uniref:Alpha-(1,6)-fucosyltransferase-like n=1 Tax=Phallusia mammillata TaxID=59560 RepID=A0A6F9DE28_9ASCI|nr:Alpha-(1,6)-fucosyltransferase-like [Phallusia mammillata]